MVKRPQQLFTAQIEGPELQAGTDIAYVWIHAIKSFIIMVVESGLALACVGLGITSYRLCIGVHACIPLVVGINAPQNHSIKLSVVLALHSLAVV